MLLLSLQVVSVPGIGYAQEPYKSYYNSDSSIIYHVNEHGDTSVINTPNLDDVRKNTSIGDNAVFVRIPDEPKYLPQFNGDLEKYIRSNLVYPQLAKEKGISGNVYLRFYVNTIGEISNIQVVKSVHPLLDNEAIRLIKNMPPWKPAVSYPERGKH